MKVKYVLGATALSLILAGTAYPQQEQEKEKPQQQEQKPAEQPKQKPAEQPKTQQRQEQQSANKHQQQEQKDEQKNQQEKEKQSARQNEQQKQPEQTNRERQDQQKQMTKQQQDEQKQQQRQQQQVAKQQRTDERDQHSDHGHGRIPDDRFRASFGREHHFRVGHFDNRRFQYGGYWFSFNEGWPVGWAYTDDFYIDFIDGQYYLIDLSRPGVQLLLVVD
ncbi:MAG TPA: cell envelope integrity protein TolA [Candidatus Acidoferrales bacterium]